MSPRPDMRGWRQAYHLRIDEPTVLLNAWQRMNRWQRKQHQDALAWLVRAAVKAPPAGPLYRARVHVIRGNPPPRPDYDNLVGGLKSLIDVLCCPRGRNPRGLGFIIDDAQQYLESLTAESVTTRPRQGFTEIEIWTPEPAAGQAVA